MSKKEKTDFAAKAGAGAGVVSAAGTAGAIVSGISGLSASGITSTLAAMGGSMVGGVAVAAAAPVIVGTAVGVGVYSAVSKSRKKKNPVPDSNSGKVLTPFSKAKIVDCSDDIKRKHPGFAS